MFTAPRFVVVDDNPKHLSAIERSFQALGSPCMAIRYDPATALDKDHFRGVRVLVMDLNLISGAIGTDHNQHYAQIAAILEDMISPKGGPFLLVVWSANAHLVQELGAYLDRSAIPPYARPIAILALPKERFIDMITGEPAAATALHAAIKERIYSSPQISALVSWETSVLEAAAETLSSIIDLVPTDKRLAETVSPELDAVLSRLAVESVGKNNVGADPMAAVTSVLAPLLFDRIISRTAAVGDADQWRRAVTRFEGTPLPALTVPEAGKVNRMLHVAIPESEAILPTDWGVVVDVPDDWLQADSFEQIWGVKLPELLSSEFKIDRESRNACKACLIRIGAVCDYAQRRKGPITFLLAFEIPVDAKRKVKDGKELTSPDAEWKSPVFATDGDPVPFRLHANVRFPLTKTATDCGTWKVRYRLREQLLVQLISTASSYVSRPGIVSMPVQ